MKLLVILSAFLLASSFYSCKKRKETTTCTYSDGSVEVVERKHYNKTSQYEAELEEAEANGWVCVKN